MFACLYSLTTPVAALIKVAEDFTPRFEVIGPLVMLDISGLSRLFGTSREIGEQLRRAAGGPVRIAIAPTQTAAALIALGRPGLCVIAPGDQPSALASLPIGVLGELERLRGETSDASAAPGAPSAPVAPGAPASAPERDGGATAGKPGAPGALGAPGTSVIRGGWSHPRDSHAAAHAHRSRRAATALRQVEHAHAAGRAHSGVADRTRDNRRLARARAQTAALESLLDTLRRWGIRTMEQLASLPAGEVYERLGARGVLWQRLARGDDSSPLVPWVPEEPFEASLDLEWPIEGLEPLSFVLSRLFEPLARRLERADRGAAILHTHLRLVDKTVHARTLQLPASMRDPKTLRTLVLLDLESNPPAAAIDRVRVLAEPTPARVTQWALFERAQPSPEQVSTLLARLGALMGNSRVGSPRLVDSWKPGAFEMGEFSVRSAECAVRSASAECAVRSASAECAVRSAKCEVRSASAECAVRSASAECGVRTPHSALRRFRLPVPARVQLHDGRPVRLMTDRRGIAGGPIVQAAGPWRTSGEWWRDSQPARAWDRDEWDIALANGIVYRIFVERDIGQWFLEGVVD